MKTSESIKNIAAALVEAQAQMGAAKKGASNPFFKSKYADLGAVLEACKAELNEVGIVILQPHFTNERGSFVETVLVHRSGEWISGETPVVCAKQNDPQALGSAITYARRYGLQSIVSLPAEDDDGEGAMHRTFSPPSPTQHTQVKAPGIAPARPAPMNHGPAPIAPRATIAAPRIAVKSDAPSPVAIERAMLLEMQIPGEGPVKKIGEVDQDWAVKYAQSSFKFFADKKQSVPAHWAVFFEAVQDLYGVVIGRDHG